LFNSGTSLFTPKMDEKAAIPPGLPRSNPTVSYWQEPPDGIARHRSSTSLPEQADYVIIGSGISGTCIAYHLLLRKPNAKIVMIEARESSSGASGRNGRYYLIFRNCSFVYTSNIFPITLSLFIQFPSISSSVSQYM